MVPPSIVGVGGYDVPVGVYDLGGVALEVVGEPVSCAVVDQADVVAFAVDLELHPVAVAILPAVELVVVVVVFGCRSSNRFALADAGVVVGVG